LLAGAVDLLVLDELGLALAYGYLDLDAVLTTLEQRPAQMDVILSVPSIPESLMAMADQATAQLRRGFCTLKNDRWINAMARDGMLEPFQPTLVRHLDPENQAGPVLSFGCSSYGYDLRLSAQEFLIFRHVPGTVMNPKRFNPANLEPAPLHHDEDGEYFDFAGPFLWPRRGL
jgi:hypothetical protein